MHQLYPCFEASCSKSARVRPFNSPVVYVMLAVSQHGQACIREVDRGPSCRSLCLLSRRRISCRICEHLQWLLPSQFLAGNRDWVLTRQATEAHVVPRMLQRRDEAAEGEVTEAVRIDEVRDLGDRLLVRDELVPRLHVDPEVAGEANRRAPDSDMDLASAR